MKKMIRCELSQKLKRKRIKIDFLDRKLLTLLNQRLHIVLEIRKIKKEMGKKIYDPKREKEVLERLRRKNKGPLKKKDLEKIFSAIMEVSRKSQI
jgi:chorismate mutase / prephenate dehydratase